jgi:hypothetical protein
MLSSFKVRGALNETREKSLGGKEFYSGGIPRKPTWF